MSYRYWCKIFGVVEERRDELGKEIEEAGLRVYTVGSVNEEERERVKLGLVLVQGMRERQQMELARSSVSWVPREGLGPRPRLGYGRHLVCMKQLHPPCCHGTLRPSTLSRHRLL